MEKTQKKVLLYVNQTELRNTHKMAKEAEKEINSFVARVEKEMNKELTISEKIALVNDAPQFLETTLNFSLPDAPRKLKYEAISFNIDDVRKLWDKRSWMRFEFNQDNKGNFELAEQQPLFEAHKIYATPKQLLVLEQSKTLADALNVASEQSLNVVHNYAGTSAKPLFKIKETFAVLSFDEKEKKLIPNLEYIAHGIK